MKIAPGKSIAASIDDGLSYLSTPPRAEDEPIRLELLRTLAGRTEMVIFGGASVMAMDIVYGLLCNSLIGFSLFVVAVIGLIHRVRVTHSARVQVKGRPGSGRMLILSGLIWSAIVGMTGAICAMAGDFLLVLTTGCVVTGLAFGAVFRNAGAPRFAKIQSLIVLVPFIICAALVDLPHMVFMLIQAPLWIGGTFVTINEAYASTAKLIHSQIRVTFLASSDVLTGLSNRTHIMNILDRFKHGEEKSGLGDTYILYLDLDGFKHVNDQYGHAAGDELLKAVAGRLSADIRAQDSLGRIGGDEFIAVINGLSCDQTEAVAQRMVQHLAEPFHLKSGQDVSIGASIGGAPMEQGSPDSVLEKADRLLYAAKRAGKGTVRLECAA